MSAEVAAQRLRDDAPLKSGLLRRLSRSSSKSTQSLPGTGENANAAPPRTKPWLPKTKVAAFTRLKARLGKRGEIPKVQFPPSSWNAERDAFEATPAAPLVVLHETTNDTALGIKPSSSSGVERDPGGTSANSTVDPPNTETAQPGGPDINDSQMMSAATLARRIHSLLSAFPPFYTLSPSGTLKLPKLSSDNSDPDVDAGSPLADSKLLSLLSSASAMNGSISKGRESVWAILERLGYASNRKSECQAQGEDEQGLSSNDDNAEVSSVMICCPLEPSEDTEVEIARSEIVSIDLDETAFESTETPQAKKVGLNLWPFGKGKSKASSPEPPSSPAPKVKEVRVWLPSRTKVSLQAAWWGYRIYLPPPVMRVLSDKSLEAAKRAAMITAALSWLVSHIPMDMLPPQLKAVVGIVKGIVPIVGYVGGFIAWSWSTIQSFDTGQGVILSATWLLPIALVPGTWDYTGPSSFLDSKPL